MGRAVERAQFPLPKFFFYLFSNYQIEFGAMIKGHAIEEKRHR
jgi:hypothetical protein